jgi:hypothetical protein
MKTIILIAASLLAGISFAPSVLAQSGGTYDLSWSTIDGGGGTSTGGAYSISGTFGQPDAGVMSGGSYSVTGGFWSLYSLVPSANTPSLTIAQAGGIVIFSWPSPSTGFQLEQAFTMTSPSWNTVPNTPSDNGTIKSVALAVQPGERYFRLHKP